MLSHADSRTLDRPLILLKKTTKTHSMAKLSFANLRRFGLKLQVRSGLFRIELCEEAEGEEKVIDGTVAAR